jgi:hypothetical protein
MKYLVPNCWFEKIFSLPTLALKSPDKIGTEISWQNFRVVLRGIYWIHVLVPHRSCPLYHQLYPLFFSFIHLFVFHKSIQSWGMNIQNNITPATSLYYTWNHITNKLHARNCWYDFLIYIQKTLSLIYDSHSPFHRKMYDRLLVQCDPCPIWPPVLPLNLSYSSVFLLQVLLVKLGK